MLRLRAGAGAVGLLCGWLAGSLSQVRAHPHAVLTPIAMPVEWADDDVGMDTSWAKNVPPPRQWQCEEFVVNELFRRRPWRTPLAEGIVPDY